MPKALDLSGVFGIEPGVLGGIRTHGLSLRRRPLYPTELRGLIQKTFNFTGLQDSNDSIFRIEYHSNARKTRDHKITGLSGGDKRDRTADLLNAIQALSQLSYTPRLCVPSLDCLIIISAAFQNVNR